MAIIHFFNATVTISLLKLLDWVQSENVLNEKQMGFKGDCSNLDQLTGLVFVQQ